jgi:putative transposase
VSYVEAEYEMSERHACRLLGLGRSTHRYRGGKAERDLPLRTQLKELAAKRMRFGYRRLRAMLEREGMSANHKRVYRLYRQEGLAMRIRQRRRIRWNGVLVKPAASQPNERWSMDFVSDCVSGGKVIRMVTIVDDCTRECPVIEVDSSLGGLRVRRVLDRMAIERGLPEAIVVDNGPEFRPGGLERGTSGAAGVHSAGQAGTECLHRKLQRTTARRMSERELVHQLKRCTAKDRNLAARLQRRTPTQFVELLAARRVCTDSNGDAGMRKASTRLPEQGTQTPSPAPDLIPLNPSINRELTLRLVQHGGTSAGFLLLTFVRFVLSPDSQDNIIHTFRALRYSLEGQTTHAAS